ncbi:MAG: YicC family protein [Kiritimatiellae bacterium]|nr:YicC family protein [Kiritimatiellia bacterium]
MSLHSMTGYGHGAATGSGVKIEIELSSVNRKQLDIHLSLPKELLTLEPWIQEEIHKALGRGRVTGQAVLTYFGAKRKSAIRVDEELAGAYVASLRRTAKRLGLSMDLSADFLLRLPEVVRFEPPSLSLELLKDVSGRALRKALGELRRMREREGRELERDLKRRVKLLERFLGRIEKRAPEVARRHRGILAERLKEAGAVMEEGDNRLLREVALFADRSDISEETTRLRSHLKQALALMQGAAAGRSLDFLVQEMLREINTIGSKASDAMIAGSVVAFKAELERMREQIQNVE